MTWLLGDAPFAVDELLARGRALDQAAREGLPVDVAQAVEVVDTLSAYVASLSAEQQQETARRLVEALKEQPRYEATVRRRRRFAGRCPLPDLRDVVLRDLAEAGPGLRGLVAAAGQAVRGARDDGGIL